MIISGNIATICINIILAVSLNLITGFTGQFSWDMQNMSIGAYSCAIVLLRLLTIGGFCLVCFWRCFSFVNLLWLDCHFAFMRLSLIATLGMSEIIRVVFINIKITNGAAGLSGIPRFTNWFFFICCSKHHSPDFKLEIFTEGFVFLS